jgi:hypothetical protein
VTHQEHREAVRLDKRISARADDRGGNRQEDAREFIDEVRVFRTTRSSTDAEDLVRRVRARLGGIAARTMRPGSSTALWFRADRISDRGGQVRVEATVRDPAVAEAQAAASATSKTPSRCEGRNQGYLEPDRRGG